MIFSLAMKASLVLCLFLMSTKVGNTINSSAKSSTNGDTLAVHKRVVRNTADSVYFNNDYIVLGGSGTVTYPEGGGKYKNNDHVQWWIEAKPDEHVTLTFHKFDLEEICDFDYLMLYDIVELPEYYSVLDEKIFCGYALPPPFVSQGNIIELVFHSDDSLGYMGFQVDYHTGPDSSTSCHFVLEVFNFSTPVQFPASGRYGNDQNCSWLLQAPEGQYIHFVITKLDIEYSTHCEGDFLEFHDGRSFTDASIGQRLCGTAGASPNSPMTIRSSGNSMYVEFMSDYSRAGEGFQGWYKLSSQPGPSPCPGLDFVLEGSGTLTFPQNGDKYVNFLNCPWLIQVGASESVQLTFRKVDIEFEEQCMFDALFIFNGLSLTSPWHILCGNQTPTLTSASNMVVLFFHTDGFITGTGFELDYKGVTVSDATESDCGRPMILRNMGRIIGGKVAVPHSWPWQVSLQDTSHFCGGTVLNDEWIITAAHCVINENIRTMRVIAGAHEKASFAPNETSRQIRRITRAVIYPGYNELGAAPDAALLKLDSPLILDFEKNKGTVHPICLPSEDDVIPHDVLCVVTGWGETYESKKAPFLNELDIPLINDNLCKDFYGPDIQDFEVCGGFKEGGKDSCLGDSGGPLACPKKGSYTLHGITSWGLGCALPENPGVYTKVKNIVRWIKRTIG